MDSLVNEFLESLEGSYIIEGAFIVPQNLLFNASGSLVIQENKKSP